MQVLGQGVADNADAYVRKVTLSIDAAVVLGTPVDTGRARSNWIATLDAPSGDVVDPLAGAASASASIAAAGVAVAVYTGDRNKTLHITNNLAYIERLNEGHSAQAPSRYVEQAIDDGVTRVRGTVVLTKVK